MRAARATRIRNEPPTFFSLYFDHFCTLIAHRSRVRETRRRTTQSTLTPSNDLRLISLAAVIGAWIGAALLTALPVAIWAKARKSHLLSAPRLLACCQ